MDDDERDGYHGHGTTSSATSRSHHSHRHYSSSSSHYIRGLSREPADGGRSSSSNLSTRNNLKSSHHESSSRGATPGSTRSSRSYYRTDPYSTSSGHHGHSSSTGGGGSGGGGGGYHDSYGGSSSSSSSKRSHHHHHSSTSSHHRHYSSHSHYSSSSSSHHGSSRDIDRSSHISSRSHLRNHLDTGSEERSIRDYRDYRGSSRETDRSHISSRNHHRNSHLETSTEDKIGDYYHNSRGYSRDRDHDRSRERDSERDIDLLESSGRHYSSRDYDRDGRVRDHRDRNHQHHQNNNHNHNHHYHRQSNSSNYREFDRFDDRRSTDDHRSDSRSRSDDDSSDIDHLPSQGDPSKCTNVITDVTNVIAPTTTTSAAACGGATNSPATVVSGENGTSRSLSPSQLTLENLDSIINSLSSLAGLPDLRKLPPDEAMETIRKVLDLMKKATSGKDPDGKIGYNLISGSLTCNLTNSITSGGTGTAETNGSTPACSKRVVLNGNLVSNDHHTNASTGSASNSSGKGLHLNNKLPDMSQPDVPTSGPTKLPSTTGNSAGTSGGTKLNGLGLNNGALNIPSPSSVISDYSLPGSPSDSGVDIQVSSSKLVPSTLAPSLVNCFREDLIKHVQGWPADVAEKQAAKLAEEAHNLGSIEVTRVSAELKMARSLVRLTEIQATLQEQRILSVRQQIKEVEEWKSQHVPSYVQSRLL